jgi:hypothetical protein
MLFKNKSKVESVHPEHFKMQSLLLFVGVVVATLLQRPAQYQVWDARSYLDGSVALISRTDIYKAGGLDFRGSWTPIFYSPAAALQHVFGLGNSERVINAAVLLQGALLVASVSVFLIPSVMKIFFPQNLTSLFVSASLGWVVMRKFALYSLMDLWAVALILLAICFLKRRTTVHLGFAGVLLGVCSNIRPSYLPVVVALLVIAFYCMHYRGLIFFAGFVAAQSPQIMVNWLINHRISLFPIELTSVGQWEFGLSLYSVRYDTIGYPIAQGPRLFCDPAMVKVALNDMPTSLFEYLKVLASHPINGSWFILEKIGAALQWPASAPFFEQKPTIDALFGVTILLTTVFGLASLILIRAQTTSFAFSRLVSFFVIAWSFFGLSINHVETRYALPIVIFGIVGVAGLVGRCIGSGHSRLNIRGGWLSVFSVLTIATLLLTAGYVGLHHTGACPTGESLKKAYNLP